MSSIVFDLKGDAMVHPTQEVYGTWRLYGDAILRKRDELQPLVRPTQKEIDVHEQFLYEALDMGSFYGGRGFNMDKLFWQTVNPDIPSEVVAFETALFVADQLFRSQDLMRAS